MISKTLKMLPIYNSDEIPRNTAIFCLIVVVAAFMFYKWREGPFYRNSYRLDGKVVIVTGCNTGIGKEIACDLAGRGARVYMACRDRQRCEQARQEIISATHNPNVFNSSTIDLSSLKSIRTFADDFKQRENHLDILINNAGILATPRSFTQDGFELQFAVNHLGHFLLTNLLLDHLKAATKSRIVVVSSMAHFMGRINKQDLNGIHNYNKLRAYAQSKLANILFTRYLAKLLKNTAITVNCLHPGIVYTGIFKQNSFIRIVTTLAGKFFFRSVRGGAQTALYLAIDPELEGKSGDYYDKMKISRISINAQDDEMAEWLWQESEKLVGLKHKSN